MLQGKTEPETWGSWPLWYCFLFRFYKFHVGACCSKLVLKSTALQTDLDNLWTCLLLNCPGTMHAKSPWKIEFGTIVPLSSMPNQSVTFAMELQLKICVYCKRFEGGPKRSFWSHAVFNGSLNPGFEIAAPADAAACACFLSVLLGILCFRLVQTDFCSAGEWQFEG